MRKTRHIAVMTIVALLCCSAAFGQKLKYDVILFGKKIGETVVEMRDSAGIKHYTLRSHTAVKMFFTDKTSAMSTDVIFGKDGVMSSSAFENVKDDATIITKAIWDKGKLLVEKDGEKTTLPTAVNTSSLLLYFSEPHNLQKVFSERLGEFFDITKESNGKYSAQTKSGAAVYTYVNGKLTELEMKSTLGSVFMKLAN